MATLYLKSGEIIQVPLEELEDFIYANKDKIQTRRRQRRGPRRGKILPQDDAAASTSSR